MRLSEIRGHDAFEALADLIGPISELAADEEVMACFRGGKPVFRAAEPMLRKHEEAVTSILATLERKSSDELFSEINLFTLPQKLIAMLVDPDFLMFFRLQSQSDKGFSGSASGSGTETEGFADSSGTQ